MDSQNDEMHFDAVVVVVVAVVAIIWYIGTEKTKEQIISITVYPIFLCKCIIRIKMGLPLAQWAQQLPI
jgi:hypothetical protein